MASARRIIEYAEYRLILWLLMRTARDIRELPLWRRALRFGVDRVLLSLLRQRMRRHYPDSPLLREPGAILQYLHHWQRHLNLVVFTPIMRAVDGLSIFRNYTFTLDSGIENALQEGRPVVLSTYHRNDLADLFGSMVLYFHRSQGSKKLRIVALRLDPLDLREAIWSLFGDFFGIDIVILCTKDPEFPRLLMSEFQRGSLFIYMCDMPAQPQTQMNASPRPFLGLPTRLDLGLLKLALGAGAEFGYLTERDGNVRLERIETTSGARQDRYMHLQQSLLDHVARDATEGEFRWVGWLEHTLTPKAG